MNATATVPVRGMVRARSAVPRIAWRAAAPTATAIGFFVADLLTWASASSLVYGLRAVIWREAPFLWITWSTFLLWFLLRVSWGFYRIPRMAPAGELRRSAMLVLTACAIHAALLLAAGEVSPLRLSALLVWLFLLPIDWVVRGIVRASLIRAQLYGHPVVVLGTGARLRRVLQELVSNPDAGLVPVAAFDADPGRWETSISGVPVLGSFDAALSWTADYPVRRAVIAIDEESGWSMSSDFTHRLTKAYPTLSLVTELGGVANLWARPRPVGVYLALEVPHARYSVVNRGVKRAFDLALTVPVMLVAGPVIAVAALLVKVFSPGPAFFRQEREGEGGRVVRVYKIRTMVPNAEQRLAEYLRDNEEARFEWERFLKLRKDPRVIPVVGQLFRRFSIDELPQLWHVLTGEMSLVGPRIFALWHVARFPEEFRALRRQVPPGMTGLWQVAHRNSGDLKIQEIVDSYYIHNWSVWMDLWILFRTVRIVLTGKGAY